MMIHKIDHSNPKESVQIREVFQASYTVEAELLGAKDFPPLKRPLEGYINSASTFLGFYEGDELAAVIEIQKEIGALDIHSLVVHPTYFRRGIASKLLNFIFQDSSINLFIVETGAANVPAITLYERHGFVKTKQWMTEIGIEKVAFEKKTD